MSETGFTGFPPDGLAFLRELAENNERSWFQANRDRYDRGVLAPCRALVAALSTQFAAADIPLTADPLKAVFRIHRDVRFSRDKRPYKTNAGAILNRDGDKSTLGVLYIHIAAEGSFAACGFYQPEAPQLAALRTAIASRSPVFQHVIDGLGRHGLQLSTDSALSRMPRGFEAMAESPLAQVLRLKHLMVRQPLDDRHVTSEQLVTPIVNFSQKCMPLLRFGWTALS